MGSLTETFVCEPVELEAMKAIGTYYHGEVLGKHSDITGTLSDETLEVLVDGDDDFIRKAMSLKIIDGNPFSSGLADRIVDDGGVDECDDLIALGQEKVQQIVSLWGLADD